MTVVSTYNLFFNCRIMVSFLICAIILGRMFDKVGNMRQWWTNKTVEEYINRTYCFINQYNEYFIPEISENVGIIFVDDSFECNKIEFNFYTF